MINRQQYIWIALILTLLLGWTQQLVAAHGIVHPFHDGGSQKKAPGSDSPLCDLCVISALDNVPSTIVNLVRATVATLELKTQPVRNQTHFIPSHYHSRAPPLFLA